MAPSLTGRGWGWVVFFAAEAVSRFPGPPLEDPPTSPPRNSTGARGGSAVGRLAHGLPPPHGRCSVAADVPARLAQRLQRSRPDDHEQRRLCGRRATKRSDWRGGRAAASTSMNPVFSGPAPGLAGGRGDGLARAQLTERSAVREQRVSPSSGTVGRVPATDMRARAPRPREGPPSSPCRRSRPGRVARRMEAHQGRDRDKGAGSMRSTTA
jgi:hypothetical protein